MLLERVFANQRLNRINLTRDDGTSPKWFISFKFHSPGGATIVFVLVFLYFLCFVVLIFSPPKPPVLFSGSRKSIIWCFQIEICSEIFTPTHIQLISVSLRHVPCGEVCLNCYPKHCQKIFINTSLQNLLFINMS